MKRSADEQHQQQQQQPSPFSEEELMILERVLKKAKRPPPSEPSLPQPSTTSSTTQEVRTDRLIHLFNSLLGEVIHEDGFTLLKQEGKLYLFTGILQYPNQITMTLHQELFKIQGVVRTIYEKAVPVGGGEGGGEKKGDKFRLIISYTLDKSLSIQYRTQDHAESQKRLVKMDAIQEKESVAKGEAEMILFTLRSNLQLLPILPKIDVRNAGDGLDIITITVVVQSPIRNYQIDGVIAGLAGKIKLLQWGPQPLHKELSLTLEINSTGGAGGGGGGGVV